VQTSTVHLGHRRRRQRGVVEGAEELPDGSAELPLDDAPDPARRLGWHVVEQAPELGGQEPGEQAGARRDELAELDEGGSELDEAAAQRDGEGLRRLAARLQHERARRAGHGDDAVASQHGRDLDEPADVGGTQAAEGEDGRRRLRLGLEQIVVHDSGHGTSGVRG
jgi:hypothetical protein